MTYDSVLKELVRATDASRTSLRHKQADSDFPVVAEALASRAFTACETRADLWRP